MVLWEITLGTAYFLGLKRTYKLALRIQRRIISPKYPKVRQFLHRRTRAVFDVAIKVHRNIQERDIEVGRNVGNFILRWLDRMKPSAQIRGPPSRPPLNGGSPIESMTKHATGTSNQKPTGYTGLFKRDSDRHLFTSSRLKPFPTIARMIKPPNPAGTIHGRHLSFYTPDVIRPNYRVNWSGSVIRPDIMQWMMQN